MSRNRNGSGRFEDRDPTLDEVLPVFASRAQKRAYEQEQRVAARRAQKERLERIRGHEPSAPRASKVPTAAVHRTPMRPQGSRSSSQSVRRDSGTAVSSDPYAPSTSQAQTRAELRRARAQAEKRRQAIQSGPAEAPTEYAQIPPAASFRTSAETGRTNAPGNLRTRQRARKAASQARAARASQAARVTTPQQKSAPPAPEPSLTTHQVSFPPAVLAEPQSAASTKSSAPETPPALPQDLPEALAPKDTITEVVAESGLDETAPRKRTGLWITLALILVLGGIVYTWNTIGFSFPSLTSAADYEGEGTGSVKVRIYPGDGGAKIGERLQKAGVVKSAAAFQAVAGSDERSKTIRPGIYQLRKEMSAKSALALILEDKSFISSGIVIRPGEWKEEIYDALADYTGTDRAEYAKVTPADLGLPASAGSNIEGYLLPGTYNFAEGATAKEQLKSITSGTTEYLKELGVSSDRAHRILTIASIIRAESPGKTYDGKISRVVYNRLDKNQPLAMDSTIHYIYKQRGIVTTTDAQRDNPSRYNTYRYRGLPPGPIGNPGKTAIKAALEPTAGNWLYFVTVNLTTGETRFSDSYEKHRENQALFQKWCQDNPGKGCE